MRVSGNDVVRLISGGSVCCCSYRSRDAIGEPGTGRLMLNTIGGGRKSGRDLV